VNWWRLAYVLTGSVPPDAGLYAFTAAGRGAATCMPISFLQLSSNQNYLGAPLAAAEGKVFMASADNNTGRTNVYAMGFPGRRGGGASGSLSPAQR
jgi:hypothetical protein